MTAAAARFAHPFLTIALPDGWTAQTPPAGLAALFEGPDHEMVNVVVGSAGAASEAELERMMAHHHQSIRGNYPRCHAETPVRRDGPGTIVADRVYQADGEGRPWTIHARYAFGRYTQLTDLGTGFPYVQIVYYASSWGANEAVLTAIREATLMDAMRVASLVDPPAPADPSAPEDLAGMLRGLRTGLKRHEIERAWPPEVEWSWDEARQTLSGRPEAVSPFALHFEMPGGALRAVRMQLVRAGDWALMENLDAHVAYQLHGFTLTSVGRPWDLAQARGRLEGKGSARMMAAVPVEATDAEGLRVSGKALAFRVEDRQSYGFELTFRPPA